MFGGEAPVGSWDILLDLGECGQLRGQVLQKMISFIYSLKDHILLTIFSENSGLRDPCYHVLLCHLRALSGT